MLLANRAETAALVLPGSSITAWGKFRLVEQGEGGVREGAGTAEMAH